MVLKSGNVHIGKETVDIPNIYKHIIHTKIRLLSKKNINRGKRINTFKRKCLFSKQVIKRFQQEFQVLNLVNNFIDLYPYAQKNPQNWEFLLSKAKFLF